MIKKIFNTESENITLGTNYLMDSEMGIRERGLLTTMLAMSDTDTENFSIRSLASILPEGECQIGSTLNKLEKLGYLVRIRNTSHGKVVGWEYIISDSKLPDDIRNQSFRNTGSKTDKHIEKTEKPKKERKLFKPKKKADTRTVQHNIQKSKPYSGYKNPDMASSFNKSDLHEDTAEKMDAYTRNHEMYSQIVKENISYDYISDIEKDTDMLDEMVEIITDTVCTNAPDIRVGREAKPANMVKSVFLKLNDSHILYVLENLRNTNTNIKNIKAYIVTSLYNAVMTINTHIKTKVNHDMGINSPVTKTGYSFAGIKPLF